MKGAGWVSAVQLLERDFLEQRMRLLELAAFLDRLDRRQDADSARSDYRYHALTGMLKVIGSAGPGRVEQILRLLSDPGREPEPDAVPPGRATGAWKECR